ncbi:MAG: hypothetical protein L6Q95_05535 [Planctomycetes bacterium]|nr:hypothetical protein [Planctomycetota bacterium]
MLRRVLALLAALGCAGSDTTGVEPEDLLGTWEATEYRLFDLADPARELDLIAAGGSATLRFHGDGTFELALSGAEPPLTTGEWQLEGSHRLVLAEEGATGATTLEVSLWTTVLILGCDEWVFDFGEGPVPAQLSAVFARD